MMLSLQCKQQEVFSLLTVSHLLLHTAHLRLLRPTTVKFSFQSSLSLSTWSVKNLIWFGAGSSFSEGSLLVHGSELNTFVKALGYGSTSQQLFIRSCFNSRSGRVQLFQMAWTDILALCKSSQFFWLYKNNKCTIILSQWIRLVKDNWKPKVVMAAKPVMNACKYVTATLSKGKQNFVWPSENPGLMPTLVLQIYACYIDLVRNKIQNRVKVQQIWITMYWHLLHT